MDAIKRKLNPLISAKYAKKLVACLIFIFVFEAFLFPPASASASEKADASTQSEIANEIIQNDPNLSEITKEDIIIEKTVFQNTLPVNDDIKVISAGTHPITAYNSEASQCDAAPCITANGFNVCEHGKEDTIAANWLEFGTKVRIPELFGDRIFIVRDRMNKRYKDSADIWFKSKTDAIRFGFKIAKIEVLEP